jgi:hypothetical protein
MAAPLDVAFPLLVFAIALVGVIPPSAFGLSGKSLLWEGRPGRNAQLQQAPAADWARSVSRYDLVSRC